MPNLTAREPLTPITSHYITSSTPMPPKREPSTRHTSTRSQPVASSSRTRTRETNVGRLADSLAVNLTLDEKRSKVTPRPQEDICTTSMRTINTLSKQLSAMIQKPSSRSSFKPLEARNALQVLRENGKGIDVERAALSMVGKLIALEKVCVQSPANYALLRGLEAALEDVKWVTKYNLTQPSITHPSYVSSRHDLRISFVCISFQCSSHTRLLR